MSEPERDLVLIATVTDIQPLAQARSKARWQVTTHVDRVLSGDYANETFAFLVHSPEKSGLVGGGTYTIKAQWTGNGYQVDEYQWRGK